MTARTLLLMVAGAFLSCAGAVPLTPAVARADDVQDGKDVYATVPPSEAGLETYQRFEGSFAIPADFFAPGSDPFTGQVTLEGAPLMTEPGCGGDLGNADTVVRRSETATLPDTGSVDQIPVEIVSLNLVSVEPIIVTYNGGQNGESWNLRVNPSPTQPSVGNMTIRHTEPTGGFFDVFFSVYWKFTFTRVSDQTVRTRDMGQEATVDTYSMTAVPWRHAPGADPVAQPSCVSNFVGSYDGTKVDSEVLGGYGKIGLRPASPSGPSPAAALSWGGLKALFR